MSERGAIVGHQFESVHGTSLGPDDNPDESKQVNFSCTIAYQYMYLLLFTSREYRIPLLRYLMSYVLFKSAQTKALAFRSPFIFHEEKKTLAIFRKSLRRKVFPIVRKDILCSDVVLFQNSLN